MRLCLAKFERLWAWLAGASVIGLATPALAQPPRCASPQPPIYVAPLQTPYCPTPPQPAPAPTPVPSPDVKTEAKTEAKTAPAPVTERPSTAATPPTVDTSSQDSSPGDSGESLSGIDSSVGYIDNAIPANVLRLRYDTAYDNNRPNRAEFFYARGAPGGPGLPKPETSVDFQEFTAYLEARMRCNFSVFLEAPVRFLNPEINDNHWGYGDMYFGFKNAFVQDQCTVASFQTKLFIPSGDSTDGLGNNHFSVEPGVLFYHKLNERLRLHGELRDWIPLGGTSFAGNVLRYGLGLSYGEHSRCGLWITPVAEFVGWTVLNGKETVTFPTSTTIQQAAGDTIINAKLGLRLGLADMADFYAGYGRALTGDVWYKEIWRFEFRLLY